MTLLATTLAAGAAAPEPEVDEDNATTEGVDLDTEETAEPEEGEEGDEPRAPAEEFDEVEHEGKKYKIPKPLKGAMLMQADYTRKTQEVAEQRKQIEQERVRVAEEQKLHAEHLTEIAKVVALDEAIKEFQKADWNAIKANNPAAYDQLWFQYQQTKENREKAVVALQQKVQERCSKAQQEAARRIEEARTA